MFEVGELAFVDYYTVVTSLDELLLITVA